MDYEYEADYRELKNRFARENSKTGSYCRLCHMVLMKWIMTRRIPLGFLLLVLEEVIFAGLTRLNGMCWPDCYMVSESR